MTAPGRGLARIGQRGGSSSHLPPLYRLTKWPRPRHPRKAGEWVDGGDEARLACDFFETGPLDRLQPSGVETLGTKGQSPIWYPATACLEKAIARPIDSARARLDRRCRASAACARSRAHEGATVAPNPIPY